MTLLRKSVALGLAAFLTAGALAACTTPVKPPNDPPPAADPNNPGPGETAYRFDAVADLNEVPASLKAWVAAQQGEEGGHQWAHTEKASYLAITGGMKPSGGYTIGLKKAQVVQKNGRNVLQVEVLVSPPKQGEMTTQALTNPVAYFRLTPRFEGQMELEVATAGPTAPAIDQFIAWLEQADGAGGYVVRGMATVSSVTVKMMLGEQALGEAKTAQVKDGHFAIHIEGVDLTKHPGAEVQVEAGDEVKRIPARNDLAVGQRWSDNFVAKAEPTSNGVKVSGLARAYEGVFKVEIRVSAKIKDDVPGAKWNASTLTLASQSIKADHGAPAFGAFEALIPVSGSLSLNAEAWFIIQSPKDGQDLPQLVVPVQINK